MSNFKISSNDKYEGRCAEIFITEKQFMVYHCSVCDEIYGIFNELLKHIQKEHYANAREKSEIIDESQDVGDIDNDNQINETGMEDFDLESYLKMKPNVTNKQKQEQQELVGDINMQIVSKSLQEASDKKPVIYTALLKNKSIERTEIRRFERYQPKDTKERKYKCGICSFTFESRSNLRNHIVRHSEPQFACSMCPSVLYSKQELMVHENRHNGVRPYLCTYCGERFFCTSSISRHIKKHHTEKSIRCEICDRKFVTRYNLKVHLLTHSEIRNFACTLCPAKFKSKPNLKGHIKSHQKKYEKSNKKQLTEESDDDKLLEEKSYLAEHGENEKSHDINKDDIF